jgi:hypothetical protein
MEMNFAGAAKSSRSRRKDVCGEVVNQIKLLPNWK